MTKVGAYVSEPALGAAGGRQAQMRRNAPEAALRDGGRAVVTSLLYLSVALIFLLSPVALFDLGFNYGGAEGSFFGKIHPGTWVAGLALILATIGYGNPLRLFDKIISHKGLAIFVATWMCLFFYSGMIRKVPATPFIDTFLLPIILFLLIDDTKERQKRVLALLVHFFLNINAILGIVEYLTGFRLTPPSAELGSFAVDWRSTALFGHPLGNASMAGAYALALAVGGGRDLPAFLRPLAIALQAVALVTFGGRAALVTTLVLLAGVVTVKSAHILRGGRINIVWVAMSCFAIPLVATAAITAAQAGFFDQLIGRFVSDDGSASTRVIMFRLFDILPLRDIILGPDLDTLASIQYQEGIDYGIESFWIGFILTDGLAISLIFFAGLAAFCWDLVRVTRPATSLLLFFFFAVASTSVSLSVKTPLFAMFIVLLLALMRNSRPERRFAGALR